MIEQVWEFAKTYLSKQRLIHTLGVLKIVKEFCRIYNLDSLPFEKAAILHDIAKDLPLEKQIEILKKNNIQLTDQELKCPGIIHGFSGALIARNKFDLDDEIFEAIFYHSTGHPDFKTIGKILFLSDYLDPSRKLNRQKEIFKIAKRNLSYGIIETIKEKINYVISEKNYIHPLTIDFYNDLLKNLGL